MNTVDRKNINTVNEDQGLGVEKCEPVKKRVTIAQDARDANATSPSPATTPPTSGRRWLHKVCLWFSSKLGWVLQNWTWSKIKPAIRCAVVGWLSAVLFIVPSVQLILGQASFLILIAAFFSPPSDPFLSVLEREALILTFVSIGWAWSCFGIFFAHLARHVQDPNVTIFDVVNGQYIEAAPTVILAIFLFCGSSFFLYIRARQGPGPYLSACVFGCLCVDISLTMAALFPFPFYLVGRSIILPLAMHSALSLVASIVLFPCTISALFTTRLTEVISPLLTTLELHERLLEARLGSAAFSETLGTMRVETKQCEANLVPLSAASRLLSSDLIYSRFAPTDFKIFPALCGKLAARADGMAMYFSLVDPNRERSFATNMTERNSNVTPVPTVAPTPRTGISRSNSRDPSPDRATTLPHANYQDKYDRSDIPTSSTHYSLGSTSTSSIPDPPTSMHPPSMGHPSHPDSHSHNAHIRAHLRHPTLRDPSLRFHPQHHGRSHPHEKHHIHLHHDLLHHSLLSLSKSRGSQRESAVGVFETRRYLDLEFTKFHDPSEEMYTTKLMDQLRESCTPLLEVSRGGLTAVSGWLTNVRSGRISHLQNAFIASIFRTNKGVKASEERMRTSHTEQIGGIRQARQELVTTLELFRDETRHNVLELYQQAFEDPPSTTRANFSFGDRNSHSDEGDPDSRNPTENEEPDKKVPPHRYLFYCYIYQYHLMQLAQDVVEMLDEILKLEDERPWSKSILWTPVEHVFKWNRGLHAEQGQQDDNDDDPDVIQGLQPKISQTSAQPNQSEPSLEDPCYGRELGIPHRRDPDALPPGNVFEWISNTIYTLLVGLGGGNVVFAIKAGILTVVLSLPSLMKNSAQLAYENQFVWAIFMGQLTLARFRGDTVFALFARLISTLGGVIIGMVMWYISSGNPYGLAAVCAVCFPFFFYARLYSPISPMINLIFFVTIILVIGYSYQDSLLVLPGSPGSGFTVAWRRFVLVSIGVSAAFIVSLLPPSTTIREYQRNLLSTTSSELGSVYCSILSFANTKRESEVQEILSSLIALRNKLKKSTALRANVGYEFSLRGRWPIDRYQKITDLQMAIAYSLSHLISVVRHLEPSWALAFLRRTRFMDPDFQGDLLAVISMISSSLRAGHPLPQITPCPLIDRFMLKYHGLNVIHREAEEDYGLPRTLTFEMLKNEQYLMFCVGISTAFGIVNCLDKLMVSVKEVVGEQYHIHGIGIPTRSVGSPA